MAALHAAGIETILDVVLNHTGEGDALGPTLSLRGLDNATYYRTFADDRARYVDDTGCGNTVALDRPPALRLALDVLRYYAEVAGVDGFRFDLATTLGRRDDGFDAAAPLLQAIAQDPVLRELKLIAEPWDVGPGGYRLGAFAPGWGEWNDRYRDAARRFWRGDPGRVGELATRLAGSADVFAARSRPPSRSINFVAAHDGFTLADLVSYATKHNEANGEDNRDGSNVNDSWNHGVEGPTADPAIVAARRRDVRNLLATLLCSRGTPMLAMGDELGRTQRGNNNAYAQDNALTWVDWAAADETLVAFVARLIDLRKRHAALREDRWLTGMPADAGGFPDVEWRRPDGRSMEGSDWTNPDGRALVAILRASTTDADSGGGVAIAFNAGNDPVAVQWPDAARRLRVASMHRYGIADGTARPRGLPAQSTPRRSRRARSSSSRRSRKRRPAADRSGVAPEILDQLAAAAGIAGDWWDVAGERHIVGADTKRALLAAMGLRTDRTPTRARTSPRLAGRVRGAARRHDSGTLHGQIVASPDRCFLPPELRDGGRRFGLAAHLYALRRARRPGHRRFHDAGRDRRRHRARRRKHRRHQSAARALPRATGNARAPITRPIAASSIRSTSMWTACPISPRRTRRVRCWRKAANASRRSRRAPLSTTAPSGN